MGVKRRTPVGLVIAAVIAGSLVLGGVIMYVAGSSAGTASFGWFAYQPISGAAF